MREQKLWRMGLFALSATFTLGLASCSDDEVAKQEPQSVAVKFNNAVNAEGDETAQTTQTRSVIREGEDAPRIYTIEGSEETLYLLERTEEGIEMPMEMLDSTRGNIVISTLSDDFSSIGYRGTTATSISSTPWFHNETADHDGALYNYIPWSWAQRFGRFYGVSPIATAAHGITLSPSTHSGTPYVDFVNPTDATQQNDLLTSCSGVVEYATQGVAPAVNLTFRHALTAIKFRAGNLNTNTTITKVVFKNALSQGRYTLATDANGTGAAWSNLSNRQDFTLDLTASPVATSSAVAGGYILGDGDGYTFFMIPQQLSGNGVVAEITLKNSVTNVETVLSQPLTGFWREGYTRVYTLSQDQTDWNYYISANSTYAVSAHYLATAAGPYYVQSYREDPMTGNKEAVAWKVVGYQESADAGATWSTLSTTAPSWLQALSLYSGNGGYTANADTVRADLIPSINDSLAMYNKVLQDATPLGTEAVPYNLSYPSNPTSNVAYTTANSYVISAPGWYRLPLVYGNARKNGVNNTNAYTSTLAASTTVLKNFTDHRNSAITDPYIYRSNNGANDPDDAKIVWSEHAGVIQNLQLANGNTFLKFYVSPQNIKNGNAMIAATKNGVVVWSWHLWFDHSDAMDKYPTTNYEGKVYTFNKRNLGYRHHEWNISKYSQTRVIRVKLEQKVANNGTTKSAYFTIKQEPGSNHVVSTTVYQYGNKNAYTGTPEIEEGGIAINSTTSTQSMALILQNPGTFYKQNKYNQGFTPPSRTYYNLWSANYATAGNNAISNHVKTVYDPCPPGFLVPDAYAFTFTSPNGIASYWNANMGNFPRYKATIDNCFYFTLNSSSTRQMALQPTSRRNQSALLTDGSTSAGDFILAGEYYHYIKANRGSNSTLSATFGQSGDSRPLNSSNIFDALAVRPVAE